MARSKHQKEVDCSSLYKDTRFDAPISYEYISQCEAVAKEVENKKGPLGRALWVILRSTMIRFSRLIYLVALAALLSGAIAAYLPHIMGSIITELLDKDAASVTVSVPFVDLSELISLLQTSILLLVSLTIFQHLFDNFIHYEAFYIATQIEDTWRYLGLRKFYSLPLAWHDVHDSGKTVSKIMNAGSGFWYIVCWLFGHGLITSGVSLVIVSIAALYSTPQLWWIWIGPPILFFYCNQKIEKKAHALQRASTRYEDAANKILHDAAGNVRCVKAFHRGDEETRQYARRWGGYHLGEYVEEMMHCRKAFALRSAELLLRATLIFYCWYHRLSVSELTVLLSYQELIVRPVKELDDVFTSMQRTARKISPLLDLVNKRDVLEDAMNAVEMKSLVNDVSLEDVSFDYKQDGDDFLDKGTTWDEDESEEDEEEDEEKKEPIVALQGVDLKIKAGTTTALVGRSGAGKSTLIMLLLRFYDPTSGAVKWDGTDLRDVTRESLRKQIVWVPQETALFSRSIAENIAYGAPNATRKEIIAAAKRANAHDFILETPDGYDSVVGERGVRLSGGQRQRISIARALLSRPSLLIFDECTSQLDSESEKSIQAAIRGLKETNVTQVVIAHRLSTVLHADQIVVLDKGHIVAVGTHSELLERCPLYNKFYTLQFQGMDDEAAVSA